MQVKSCKSYTQCYRVQRRKRLYLVEESEKAREITLEMGLKGQTEFRQPEMKKERIPDKEITVSQSTEEGKPRLVTEDLRDWGDKAEKAGWAQFSRNVRKK